MHNSVYALAMTALRRYSYYYIALVAILGIFLVRFSIRRAQLARRLSWIPGPFALPIVGNALSLLGGQDEFFKLLVECGKIFGTPFRLWVGMQPFVFIGRAEDVQPILSSYQNLDKSFEYSFLHDWLGTGLITSTGTKWHVRRKLLTPSFHYSILQDFVEPIMTQCEVLIDRLLDHVGKEPFNIVPYSKLCALDIICVTAMGKEVNAQRNGNQEYVKAIDGINGILQRRFITPWLKPDFIFKRSAMGKKQNEYIRTIHSFVEEVIAEKKTQLLNKSQETEQEEGPRRHKVFLDLLLAAALLDESLTDEDVRDEVNTFMFAGHDTTSVSIAWALYVFGKHPDVQERILTEYEATVEGEMPTYKEIQKLDYLERCIKEAMRLYPVVPLIARDIKQTVKLHGDKDLVAGTTALINTVILHRDSRYFPNPDQFNPDRFLPEQSEGRHAFAFIPFSAGPRNCIGSKFATMEVKLVLIHILKKFIVTSVDKEEDLRLFSEIVLSNMNGVRLTLEERIP